VGSLQKSDNSGEVQPSTSRSNFKQLLGNTFPSSLNQLQQSLKLGRFSSNAVYDTRAIELPPDNFEAPPACGSRFALCTLWRAIIDKARWPTKIQARVAVA
jgi:hypothetical protein